ncbi:MAG: rhodanese-like domain-containing protein [Magnetococcales bacterium]|nr:rhodanese-like domain-containing protein [Magnetococcales bacterium]
MNWFRSIAPKQMLADVARCHIPRVIDLRGDYNTAIPGSIPVQFEPDVFYESERWIQDMLGVTFRENQSIVLVCQMGHRAIEALDYFREKNPKSRFTVKVLEQGFFGYVRYVDIMTEPFKRRDVFRQELTDLATPPDRFSYLVSKLLE